MGAERGKAGPASNYGRGGGPASEHEWQSPTPIKADGSRLPMFSRLIHADWSVDPRKRWQASAVRSDGSWKVSASCPVGPTPEFLDDVFRSANGGRTLVGFDFPIGIPSAYGGKTRLADFRQAL